MMRSAGNQENPSSREKSVNETPMNDGGDETCRPGRLKIAIMAPWMLKGNVNLGECRVQTEMLAARARTPPSGFANRKTASAVTSREVAPADQTWQRRLENLMTHQSLIEAK